MENKAFELLGKIKMISLMKSQFEDFTDLNADSSAFDYVHFSNTSERLSYYDDYENYHDLYHSIAAGKEVCLYHINDGRNIPVKLPQKEKSVRQTLKEFQALVQSDLNNADNLVNQRKSNQER